MKNYIDKLFQGESIKDKNIAIVGSTKCKNIFMELAKEVELRGATPYMTHLFSHTDGYELTEKQLETAVNNGKNRIDIADELILIQQSDTVGMNTQEELDYWEHVWESEHKYFTVGPIIAVHDGPFHADDVLAVALLEHYYGEGRPCYVIRTRDPKKLDSANFVVDVGEEDLIDEDHFKFKFDHHQENSDAYENGIKKAACGKVAEYLYGKYPEFLNYLKVNCLYAIEAQDNGQDISQFGKYPNPFSWVRLFNPNPAFEVATYDDKFEEAVEIAVKIVDQLINNFKVQGYAQDWLSAQIIPEHVYNHILVLNKYASWQNKVCDYNLDHDDKILAIVFPNAVEGWNVQMVPIAPQSFETRISHPASWCPSSNEELDKASGFDGGIFCHKAGWLSVWKDYETAVKVANFIVDSTNN